MELLPLVLTSGWASGINAYAVIVMLNLLGRYAGLTEIPVSVQGTSVLVIAGGMFLVEFVTDKIPYVDTAWDSISTVIRPTLGAMLGYLLAGQADTLDQAFGQWWYAAMGGGAALASHLVKAGIRLGVNASPEPVTNVAVSLGEDVAVVGVITLALYHPWLALGIAVTLFGLGLVLVIVLMRVVRRGWRRWKAHGSTAQDARTPVADVLVVGAGLGGLATAARLAKLGHQVTVLERNPYAGGAIRRIEQDGFGWDAGPSSTTLPAVLRDLFRKSGRPIERYVDLVLREPARRHVFADSSYVDLPTGSRAAQIAAVDAGLGAGAGTRWAKFVDAQGPVWDHLRTTVLDQPDGGTLLGRRDVAGGLSPRVSLAKLSRRSFKDERLRLMAEHAVRLGGSEPKDAPAYLAVEPYVERAFGVWQVRDGGMSSVVEALVTRLHERGVRLELDAEVDSIVLDRGAVRGVGMADGSERPGQIVVTDVDPRTVFGSWLSSEPELPGQRVFETATPAIPVAVTHLGLTGDVPVLPAEVVLHGEPLLVLTTSGSAPDGQHAWTVLRRGSAQEDVLVTMVRRGIDVRDKVVTRLDRTPIDLIQETGGSAYGLAWSGWRAHVQRAAQTSPLPGLHLVGASMYPGASIPYVAWGAAHVAARLGKA